MWSLKAATNFAPVTAVGTSPLPADEISVADIAALKKVGLLSPSTTTNLSLPSKLNLSKLYRDALLLPVSLSVQLSDTTASTAWAAALVELVALVTPVKVVDVTPVYVNISESICSVPLELKPVVLSTVIVPDPDIVASDVMAVASSVEAELNIFCPLAATTLFAKLTTINTSSLDDDVWGTICLTYL